MATTLIGHDASVRPRSEAIRSRLPVGMLLMSTGILYLWGLGATGWGNEYYAAAVYAGTRSTRALLFGSLDAGNAITVDKPPASLWVMGLSARLFGFSTWSLLVPQALMGVASVAGLTATVRRCCGAGAGMLAGAILAATPVAAVIFRFDNPDALLVLLLIGAAYATVRVTESASPWWAAMAGGLLGLAFLTKLGQALLVVPALVLAVLVGTSARRGLILLVGAAALVVSGLWYPVLVSLWPVDSRPYIGGSTDNSMLQLAIGYNGLDRIVDRHRSGGAHPLLETIAFGSAPGPARLFNDALGGEISWLLPAALIGLVATVRSVRGPARTALLLWGGWLLVTASVFSLVHGVIHPYYMVALAPAVAGVVAVSADHLWRRRDTTCARVALALMVAACGGWASVLWLRTPHAPEALSWAVPAACTAAAAMVWCRRAERVGAACVLACAVVSPLAYTIDTAMQPHRGAIPTAGPCGSAWGCKESVSGPGDTTAADPAVQDLLRHTRARWTAAAVSAFGVAKLELSTGTSLLALGGFTGLDDYPALETFRRYVADGAVRYFLLDPDLDGPGVHRDHSSGRIVDWVRSTFVPLTIGNTTVYDLTAPLRP